MTEMQNNYEEMQSNCKETQNNNKIQNDYEVTQKKATKKHKMTTKRRSVYNKAPTSVWLEYLLVWQSTKPHCSLITAGKILISDDKQ